MSSQADATRSRVPCTECADEVTLGAESVRASISVRIHLRPFGGEKKRAADIERLMSEAFAEELKGKPNMPLGEQAKRLVSDAYMCIYQSPDVRMYR